MFLARIADKRMKLADVYDALNCLLGTPTRVSRETYTRTETGFREHTIPWLDEINVFVAPDAHVLILGCGTGVEIEWFARRCASVVAVDVDSSEIEKAIERNAGLPNVSCVLVDDCTLPFKDNEFDLVFMHNVCEHIINIEECFAEYFRIIKPGKILINAFAPLFYSPYGAHLQDALKMPWGHLIFGLQVVVDVRNRYYPGHLKASNWAGLGLNRITERRYRKIVKNTGFRDRLYVIQTSKDLPLFSRIPILRNLFIMGIKNILVKPLQKDRAIERV